MLTLNGLSPMLAWVVHNRPLNAWATVLLTGFALGNAILGTFLLWRLLRDEPAVPALPAQDSGTQDEKLAS